MTLKADAIFKEKLTGGVEKADAIFKEKLTGGVKMT